MSSFRADAHIGFVHIGIAFHSGGYIAFHGNDLVEADVEVYDASHDSHVHLAANILHIGVNNPISQVQRDMCRAQMKNRASPTFPLYCTLSQISSAMRPVDSSDVTLICAMIHH